MIRKILHLLKDHTNTYPLDLIRVSARSHHISVILIQDAIDIDLKGIECDLYVLSGDLKCTQESPYREIHYKEMLEMIFACDAVFAW